MLTELRWFFIDARGDLGLRSNFESVARRIGGIYASQQTSGDMDGRLIENAGRYKRCDRALRAMDPRRALVLHAFAHHRELGVMLIQPSAVDEHRRSRSRKSLADWIERIAPHKGKEQDPDHKRLWLRIRADATRELDRAMHDFDLRWRRG